VGWTTTSDPRVFLAAAGAFLRSRPVEHTLLLSVSDRLAGGNPVAAPLLGWWEEGGEVLAALVRTPPRPVLLSEVPEAAVAPLAGLLREHGAPGADAAPVPTAERLAAAWPGTAAATRRQRLHRLAGLAPAEAPPGRGVAAQPRHREPLLAWTTAFGEEVGLPSDDPVAEVDARLAHGGLWVWEDAAGRPVAMAGRTAALAGMARVVSVFTPPEHRGRGYGGAVVAEVVRDALAQGVAHVLLFTDLANPVSNRLYARLGFVPVEDRVSLVLGEPPGGAPVGSSVA
jgi:predicted GNAT family acetyltransferase